jgi:hypothetical protein
MKKIFDCWISPMVNGDVPRGKQFNFCLQIVSSLFGDRAYPAFYCIVIC